MAAGLGFKDFVTGEVLTAADVDGYLMQGVWVFASAAARDAAVTSPQEGNFAYLKDTNVTTYYTGSSWANLDTTGMTNPMTTTGDTIYSSSGSTPARLGIGTTGQVLTVSGGIPSWASPASGGGMTLISTTSLSGSTVSLTSISGSYVDLVLILTDVYCSDANDLVLSFNSDTTAGNYNGNYTRTYAGSTLQGVQDYGTAAYVFAGVTGTSSTVNQNHQSVHRLPRYTSTATKQIIGNTVSQNGANKNIFSLHGLYFGSSAISRIDIKTTAGTFSSGTAYLYGVK
jgi:hypothetical protein